MFDSTDGKKTYLPLKETYFKNLSPPPHCLARMGCASDETKWQVTEGQQKACVPGPLSDTSTGTQWLNGVTETKEPHLKAHPSVSGVEADQAAARCHFKFTVPQYLKKKPTPWESVCAHRGMLLDQPESKVRDASRFGIGRSTPDWTP